MKNKIILLKGLPASGKSTYSKQFCKENPEYIRLNKDDIREFFGNPPFSSSFEKSVLTVQKTLGETAVKLGKSLIIDDTNFAEKHYMYWSSLARDNSYEFEIKFFDVPVEECIRRDKEREKSVGEMVIRSMYNKYLKEKGLGEIDWS